MVRVINAPSKEPVDCESLSIFLAGTTSQFGHHDWRETLIASLRETGITFYNPHRADWDSSWREDIDFVPYREQVEWELEKQAAADIVVIYFHPDSQAPISLLELGLCAAIPGKCIVVCPNGYWKKGNVQIVCQKYSIEMWEDIDSLKDVLLKRLTKGNEFAVPSVQG